ncbi:MAG TPA: tRNA pseudouridine(55) synthase TruB [Rhodospirillaceae bacterium]|nr:tRNA pseudouridine(55) synthase TruB [Rhodospirillaceae bacterium]
MARKRKGEKVDGWINLDKPAGMTSTQAVGKVRWLFNAQKAGHAGTLDPLATGILPIALGEATKTVPFAQDRLKTYRFTVKWGEQRDTDDGEGSVIATSDMRPTLGQIESILGKYLGEIEQTPPKFSAIKIDGQRAYDLAREGQDVELKSRIVYVETLTILESKDDETAFEITCGKGTYIRSLARDMALDLGTCGYVSALRRTAVGPFTEENAISLEKLEELGDSPALVEALLPLETALDDIPALAIKENEAARLKSGQMLSFIARPDFKRLEETGLDEEGWQTALAVYKGKPIALVEIEGPDIKPVKVLNL